MVYTMLVVLVCLGVYDPYISRDESIEALLLYALVPLGWDYGRSLLVFSVFLINLRHL